MARPVGSTRERDCSLVAAICCCKTIVATIVFASLILIFAGILCYKKTYRLLLRNDCWRDPTW